MQFSRLGRTGLVVSRLAFGTMTFGRAGGIFAAVAKVDQTGANELVARAIDQGINFFNSADVYTGGDSERILGKALGTKRKEVVIATKLGNRMSPALIDAGLSYQHVLAACDASLERLGTDYIDVYLVHKVDALTPIEETVDALEALVRAGKVRYVGFSNWPAWMAQKAVAYQRARGYSLFRGAELYYSLAGRDIEHELQPFCVDAGIGLMVWSPLAGGFLSGKYTRSQPKGQAGDRLSGVDFLPYDRESGFVLVDLLKTIGAAHGASPAQVAIAWVLTRAAVASVLIGASSSGQLNDNLGAAALQLTAEDLAKLDAATKPTAIYPNWFNERVVDVKSYEALGLPAERAIRR